VRYLHTREPLPVTTSLLLVADVAGSRIYENPNVLSRFLLVGSVRTGRSMQDAARLLRAPEFKPAEEAIVEGPAPALDGGSGGTVRLVRYSVAEIELEWLFEGSACPPAGTACAWNFGRPSCMPQRP
jgi:hypothetical protein